MDETTETRRRSGLLWLLLLLALVALWWWFRPGGAAPGADLRSVDRHATPEEIARDYAAMHGTDPAAILVDLRDDATAAEIAALERDLGIQLELVSDQSFDERFYRTVVDPARRDAVIDQLRARPIVEIAEPDAHVELTPGAIVRFTDVVAAWEGFPNDPQYKYQWHLDQIGMPQAWKMADGEGVVVAVIDTGVAYEAFGRYHLVEDLDGVEFVKPFDFVGNNPHANDDHGHGTHVAGTIGQRTHNGKGVAGVARNVKIMPLKVLDAGGRGSVGAIADSIRYAADEGADVINMSLGGPFPSRVMKKAVEYAHKKGVVIVAAAGNESRNKVGYPAAYPGVIAVAATQFDEATTFYSNHGKDVDIAAPGGNTRIDQNGDGMPDGVLQNTITVGDPTKSGYYGFMGTSMASPHVAGVAALVVQQGVTDPVEVEKILIETARKPKNQKYERDRYGAGIVDAPAAIALARQRASAASAWAVTERAGRLGGSLIALGLGLLVAGAIASSTRGRRGAVLGPAYLAGVAGAVAAYAAMAVVGFGAGSALVHSALLPFGLLALGYGVARLRAPLAGFAAGVAGHLLLAAVTGLELGWVTALTGFPAIWLVVNAVVCIALARVAIRR